jgi:hypothetical protein
MKTLIALILFITLASSILSQSPYTNVLIDATQSGGFYPCEPSICINPKNTNIIVAGAIINSYYYSTNAGLNWVEGNLTSNPYGVWGDPSIHVDTNQHFYYFHLSNPSSGGSWIDRIVCQKSTNFGVSWNNPGTYTWLNPPKKQDKQWAVVDWTGGARGNWIYVTWTEFDNYGSSNSNDSSRIIFARSTNGGNNWTEAKRINRLAGDCVDDDYTVEGAVPAVGPNGDVYVAWSGPMGLNNFKIFFDKSTDGGVTWLTNDIVAADQRGGWTYVISSLYRCNGLPVTICDNSNGPHRGTIYINYTDSAGPLDHDVMVVKSTNGGLNWSAPIRINNDAPGKEQFLTWMTVDQVTGYLYCVFYDRRNYSDSKTDVFMARSTDGGITWLNERISESPFTPIAAPFFGDYSNISAHNGVIRPIWTRLQGNTSIWTAIINIPVGLNQTSTEIPVEFGLKQNYPNPFNPSTMIRFDVPASNSGNYKVTLKIYDALGKETAELLNKDLTAGSYEYDWNAFGLPSGVYFYTLNATTGTGSGFSQTKKMVLTK